MNDYPEYAEIDGIEYKINTDYETGLACFRAINDLEISDTSRTLAVIGLLFDNEENENKPEITNYDKALEIAKVYLTCDKDSETEDSKIDMDFEFDKDLINASFMSDYQINLDNQKMHWWQFFSLMCGLTDKCILNRVRDIRNFDESTIKDSKEKEKIIKAKERVKLPVRRTREEQEAIDEFDALLGDD